MLVLSISSTTSTLNTSVGTKPTTGRPHGIDWTLTTAKDVTSGDFGGFFVGFWRLVGRGERRGRGCRGSEVRDGLEGEIPKLEFLK